MSATDALLAQRKPRFVNHLFVCAIGAMSIWSSASLAASKSTAVDDLTNIPIESLMDMEVQSASKFKQNISEAPSAVSVITATDSKPLAGALWPRFCAACQAHTSQMTAPAAIWVRVVSYAVAITTSASC